MKKRTIWIGVSILASLFLGAGVGSGQPLGPPEGGRFGHELASREGLPLEDLSHLPPAERRERIRKRVELMRMLQLTEALNLDEETATRLFARLRPIQQKRWGLFQKRQRIQRELREATKSESVDEARLETLMNGVAETQRAMSELEQEEIESLEGLLTPWQKAKYLVFREHFQQKMKERLRKARKRNGPLKGPKGPDADRPGRQFP